MSSIPDGPYGMESLLLGSILEADDDDSVEFFNPTKKDDNHVSSLFKGLPTERPSSAPPSLFINNVNVTYRAEWNTTSQEASSFFLRNNTTFLRKVPP